MPGPYSASKLKREPADSRQTPFFVLLYKSSFGYFSCKKSNLLLGGLGALLGDGGEGILAGQVDAALLVDVGDHDKDRVADGNDILNVLDAVVVQLGDVDKTLLAGGDLDEEIGRAHV